MTVDQSNPKIAATSGGQKETGPTPIVLSPDDMRARKQRNLAIGFSLIGFVVLVFVITLMRLGANVLDRPI